MLKKILKGLLILTGSLVLLLIVGYAFVYASTESKINKVYDVKLQPVTIPTDSVSYIAGKHIAENRGCIGCHGPNLAGGIAFFDEKTPIGILYTSNITNGKGGVGYTDEDWVRTLRHGLGKDNKSVWFMPSQDVCHISNEEMGQLIYFIKKQPPVDKIVPAKSLKPLGRLLVFMGKLPLFPAEIINHNVVYEDKVTPSISSEYGAYLATSCQGCHGTDMKGGPAHAPNEPAIPNISSTGNPGKWNDEGFITALRTGKTPEGKQLSDAMPYKYLTFTNNELKAILLYLKQKK